MIEEKKRIALRHIEDGRFLSWSIRSYPLTDRVTEARRFYTTEEVSHFLLHSGYKPENPEDYELVTIKITYELETEEEA